MKWRGKIIERAEEPYKIGAIEGLQYDARHCCLDAHAARHGNIYSPNEARKLTFGDDCRCDLLPYNSRWGNDLPPYSEPIEKKRARAIKEYDAFWGKDDITSLIALEGLYRQDLKWHWADLQKYADNLRKHGDCERALTWINAAINARMIQMGESGATQQEDSSLASLYTTRGNIFIKAKDHKAALRVFMIAIMHYNWKPTKTLALKINLAVKKAGISEQSFCRAIETAKKNGLNVGLSELEKLLTPRGITQF